MLEFLREKAGSWVIKSILFLIAAIFAFMGIDIINAPRNRSIAVVNGDEISIDDFHHAYNAQMNRLRGQFGGQINEEMLKIGAIPANSTAPKSGAVPAGVIL